MDQSFLDMLNQDAAQMFADLFPVAPSSRYWSHNGYEYHYTTERVDGKFWAMIYRPIGDGARTGKAKRWKLQKKVSRVKRKDAKALALRWYTLAKELDQNAPST